MPKSLADKPPKYDRCDDHPKQLKDMFCFDHRDLVCSTCSDTNHKACLTKSVDEVCKTILSSDTDALYEAVKDLIDKAKCVREAAETDIGNLNEEQKHLVQEINIMHEKAISKINELFRSVQSKAAAGYQVQNEQMIETKRKIIDINSRLQAVLAEVGKQKGKSFDAKVFLKAHEQMKIVNHFVDDFRTLNQSRCLVSLSFDHGNLLKQILSDSTKFGSLKKTESKPNPIDIKDIAFPQSMSSSAQSTKAIANPKQTQPSSSQPNSIQAVSVHGQKVFKHENASPAAAPSQHPNQSSDRSQGYDNHQTAKPHQSVVVTSRSGSMVAHAPLQKIEVRMQNSYNIKLKADDSSCWITGMAIMKDNRRLLVDRNNKQVKMFALNAGFWSVFSSDMKFLPSVSIRHKPWDIAVVNDNTAVVTIDNWTLALLDISGRQPSIRRTVKLEYEVLGISSCQDKLAVTCPYPYPPSVKMIDQTGKVHWSVSTDQQGRQLFKYPEYVCCHVKDGTSTVVVSDWRKSTLTLLNAETGEVVTTRQLDGIKGPCGVTTETAGNVYVCYYGTNEVAVLSADLSEEKILLTERDGLRNRPQAIVHDDFRRQLLVSYYKSNNIDCFQLS